MININHLSPIKYTITMVKILNIHPDNPQERKINEAIECLKKGGLIIYPTDTVYGIGCDLHNPKAVERLCRFKHQDPKKMHLSFICADLSNLSLYARNVTTPIFKAMKKGLPGPYTFILESSSKVPKIVGTKKKQVGIRVPNHNVTRMIVEGLGNPLVTTSVKHEDEVIEYMTDPELMAETFKNEVDIVIDSGIGDNIPSTVIMAANDELELLREGKGEFEMLF